MNLEAYLKISLFDIFSINRRLKSNDQSFQSNRHFRVSLWTNGSPYFLTSHFRVSLWTDGSPYFLTSQKMAFVDPIKTRNDFYRPTICCEN